MVSWLRRPRHPHAGAERAAEAGHPAREDLLRVGHRLLVTFPLLPEHLRLPRHPWAGAGDRHGREVRPARPFRLGGHRGRRQSLYRHQPLHPLPAAEPRPEHPLVEQPDLRADEGAVFADFGVRQEDQVESLGDNRTAHSSGGDRLGGRGHVRGPLGRRQSATPGPDAGGGRAAQRRIVRGNPAGLRSFQRGCTQ